MIYFAIAMLIQFIAGSYYFICPKLLTVEASYLWALLFCQSVGFVIYNNHRARSF